MRIFGCPLILAICLSLLMWGGIISGAVWMLSDGTDYGFTAGTSDMTVVHCTCGARGSEVVLLMEAVPGAFHQEATQSADGKCLDSIDTVKLV